MWFPKVFVLAQLSVISDAFSFKLAIAQTPLTEDHLKVAKLCRDVYSEDVETLDTFIESKDTGIQATVTLDGTRGIVCFRGSDAMVDWKNNFNIGKVPFLSRKHSDPHKKVHAGFFIGHNSIKGKVYKKLNELVDSGNCESILFCGHSAGATSCLVAYDYLNHKNLPLEIITFGAPRICNREFADDFNANMKCTRIINDADLVPLAPFKVLGFHHVGKLIHIKDSEVCSKDKGTFEKLVWRLKGILSFDVGIRDHDMDSYVEEIEKCLGKK